MANCDPLKIVLVLNHYLPVHVAGTEVYTHLLGKYLQLQGCQVSVIIPNYGSSKSRKYIYDNIPVYCYAEPTVVNRNLILGKSKPLGLSSFEELIVTLNPDIIHFQELAGSNGITIHHVKSAKKLGYKVVFTAHVVKYSCKKGDLILNGKELCDGIINIKRCTGCNYHSNNLSKNGKIALQFLSNILYNIRINLTHFNSSVGTAFGFPFLIEKHLNELRQLSQTCDKIVVLTSWFKSILIKNGVSADKLLHLPQALTQLNHNFSSHKYNAHLPIKLLFVGRISHFKGIHLLLDALHTLPQDKISLDIYGQETDEAYLHLCKEKSKNLGNVNWCGLFDSKDVVRLMRNYHLLCLPSTINEMAPLVIQEAYAAGIPVIASNVYGNAEFVKHNVNGLLFEINNISSLRNAIDFVIKQPSQLDLYASNIVKPDPFENVGQAYFELYNELIHENTTHK